MPTSYSQLLQPLIADPDPRGMIRFLQDRGVLASAMTCDKCHVPMNLTTRNKNSDRCAFKCPKDKCKCIKSVRHGSWFTHMRVPIQKVVWIVYLWSIHMPVGMAAQQTEVSKKSIVQMYQFLRDVCSAKLVALNGEKLGGPGFIVEIDESLFRHKPKYHRVCAPQNELWVFGMVDTSYTPCRGYMEIVERRDAATLIPIIEQHVAPGSIIHSDQWRAYAQLQNYRVATLAQIFLCRIFSGCWRKILRQCDSLDSPVLGSLEALGYWNRYMITLEKTHRYCNDIFVIRETT